MAKKPLRDIIVVLPGITGSVLRLHGRDLWALSGQAVWWGLRTVGGSLDNLRVEGDDAGGIVAHRLMADAHLVPGLVKIDGYSSLARTVRNTFDILPGSIADGRPVNFLEFPYDWRLDNRVAARRLARTVEDAVRRWRDYSGNADARVIFLAHSMGGLVARYYLEVLDGWRTCRALITFGTPYRGSLNALEFLANGYKKLSVDLTEVMRSFPAVHQLLPIYRALRVGDEYVRVAEAGLVPGVNPTLARDALAFHREIETKVTQHRNDEEYMRGGYAILPFVGIRQPTAQSALLTDRRVRVNRELPEWIDPLLSDGDGTVPRASAIPLELSDAYRDSFVPERHGSLHCNAAVLSDLRGRLEQLQVRGMSTIREPEESPGAAERPAIALDLEDAYLAGEPVTLSARLVNAGPSGALWARVVAVEPGSVSAAGVMELTAVDDCWAIDMPGLQPGLYRVEVGTSKVGPTAPPPVHDLFAVAGVADDART